MRIDLQSAGLSLPRGAAIRVRDGAGSTLQVLQGSVWVTEEGSPRDVVLQPGQRFRLAGSGLAIIEAFSDASIAVL
jgi:ferric-dicitrate binding protein FerR (iron transport regulator)